MPEEPPKELWGRHDHSLDERGRLTIPGELRSSLGTKCAVLCGPDDQIQIYPLQTWETMKAVLTNLSLADSLNEEVDALQTYLGNCDFASVDTQARLPLQRYLREWADLLEENQAVVVIGKGDRIEVWNKDKFKIAAKRVKRPALALISAQREADTVKSQDTQPVNSAVQEA